MNQPILTTNTNLLNETKTITAAPSKINGFDVFVAQEQQRKILDTMNTTYYGGNNYLPQPNNPNYIQANKQFIPGGGVIFTFGSSMGPFQNFMPRVQPIQMQPQCPCYSQIPAEELKKHCVEYMQLNNFLNNSKQITFHHNQKTSTTSLLPSTDQKQKSDGTPDFKNLGGILHWTICGQGAEDAEWYKSRAQLRLSPDGKNMKIVTVPKTTSAPNVGSAFNKKSPTREEMKNMHVADVLNEEKDKKVTFDKKPEKCCCCKEKKNVETQSEKDGKPKKAYKRKNRTRSKGKSPSRSRSRSRNKKGDSTSESSESESEERNKKPRKRRCRKKKVEQSDSSSTCPNSSSCTIAGCCSIDTIDSTSVFENNSDKTRS